MNDRTRSLNLEGRQSWLTLLPATSAYYQFNTLDHSISEFDPHTNIRVPKVIAEPYNSEASAPPSTPQYADDAPKTDFSKAPEAVIQSITRTPTLPPDYPPLEDPIDVKIPHHFVNTKEKVYYGSLNYDSIEDSIDNT